MTSSLTLQPLLLVAAIDRSLRFYRDQLGYSVIEEAQADGLVYWCRLERGGMSLMLQQAEPEDGSAMGRGRGVLFYVVCTDLDALAAEFTQRGLEYAPPVTTYYGMRQLSITDPDGYALCFQERVGS